MKAVLHTGEGPAWTRTLGATPWPLLTFGNRALLEFWMEWCADLGIREIRLVLDEGAGEIEAFAGRGDRWGLEITYSFQRGGRDAASFLQRAPEEWIADGLLHVRGMLFPRKPGCEAECRLEQGVTYLQQDDRGTACLLSTNHEHLTGYARRGQLPSANQTRPFAALGLDLAPVASVRDYYELNMALVRGEIQRYVRPGYAYRDGAGIGYNVIAPATATLTPLLLIGNDCRIGPLTSIGPDAVIGSHVIVDRQTEIAAAVILDGTFIGRGMEIRGKIVSGNMVVDPGSGAAVAIPDPWMVGGVQRLPGPGELLHRLFSRTLAALTALTQTVPFALLFAWLLPRGGVFAVRPVRARKGKVVNLPVFSATADAHGPALRLFTALGLDRYPQFLLAVAGRLWLCGHPPRTASSGPEALSAHRPQDDEPVPFPAVLSYADLRDDPKDPVVDRVEEHYYSHHRSMLEDLRILLRFMARRCARLFRN